VNLRTAILESVRRLKRARAEKYAVKLSRSRENRALARNVERGEEFIGPRRPAGRPRKAKDG